MTTHTEQLSVDAGVLAFLAELRENNRREWFEANRPRYEMLRSGFLAFGQQMIARAAKLDPALSGLLAKACVYRLNRDIRFSPDKSPYKRHFGLFVAPGGLKSRLPGHYLHIEPGGCFYCSGNYGLTPEELRRLRVEVSSFPEELHAIVSESEFARRMRLWDDNKLKVLPRGFDIAPQYADYLKLKVLCARCDYSDAQVAAPGFLDRLEDDMRLAQPLNDFFRRALLTEE